MSNYQETRIIPLLECKLELLYIILDLRLSNDFNIIPDTIISNKKEISEEIRRTIARIERIKKNA